MIEITREGVESIPEAEELWLTLFDHHVSIGAAGLATIDRDLSWPLRQAHYRRLFDEHPYAAVWLARRGDDVVGYALAHEDRVRDERATVLETLSVSPAMRGAGLGSRLMRAVDDDAGERGVEIAVVDVMGGNPRARDLYLRAGYEPLTETWMRSDPPEAPGDPGAGEELPLQEAERLGIGIQVSPGPDDTWVSSDRIADLAFEGPAIDREALAQLLRKLREAGLWTTRAEIAAVPQQNDLRDALLSEGFRLSTERLRRVP